MEPAKEASTLSETTRHYLRLSLTPGAGPVLVRRLVDHFGSVDRVLGASLAALQKVDGIGRVTSEAIFRARSAEVSQMVDDEIALCDGAGVRIISIDDAEYPRPLHFIPDPPIVLYVRGSLLPSDAVSVGVVGTRRCSYYGREQAVRFGELLGAAGFTVVSGLARGVDSHAHRGALRCGGRTIAVLGNGLSSVYPVEHEQLAEDIVRSGAVVSDLPMTVPPDPKNFPRRNRIVAGLSLGVLVVEAGERSGALITARLASEYNREVFAIPGRIDRPELTSGSNGLIRGCTAKLVSCLEDVLDDLSAVGDIMRDEVSEADAGNGAVRHDAGLSANDQAILDAVRRGHQEVDAICEEAQLDTGVVLGALTKLQILGHLRRQPGGSFDRRTSD